jgi:hypothetical protein
MKGVRSHGRSNENSDRLGFAYCAIESVLDRCVKVEV